MSTKNQSKDIDFSKQEKIASKELQDGKLRFFRQPRITKQVRIEEKVHQDLKNKVSVCDTTMSKLASEMLAECLKYY